MKLDLQSERYAATGNISGSGIRKSLGTPTLDRLQILIRESVQNAWDARREEDAAVEFRVHIRTLSASQLRALRSLLSNLPEEGSAHHQLGKTLDNSSLVVLELADFGTTGLGGPVRADEEPHHDERPDFANFFRNIGSARDRDLGAGTYGYGKSALFRVSSCGAILCHTRTSCAGAPESRFMATAIGDAFEHKRRRFTGRHWWGKLKRDDVVDPVKGTTADSIASSLGMQSRGVNDFGTSILVLDAEFEDRTPLQAANAVSECLAWFFWPKMIPQAGRGPTMRFTIQVEGSLVAALDPRKIPPLELFTQAMGAAKSKNAIAIASERPKQHLGKLGFFKGPRRPRHVFDTGRPTPLIPEQSSGIALMRPAELVVKYLPGPVLPTDMIEYAGVFICDAEVEPHFAEAEPPAHDDWIPDFLDGRGKTFVRVALRKIAESANLHATPVLSDEPLPQQRSLASVSDALGDVLLGQIGSRLGRYDETAGSTGRTGPKPVKQRVVVSDPEPFRFAVVKRTPCAVFRVHVASTGPGNIALRARPFVVLEGGAMEEPDTTGGPRIVGWLNATAGLMTEGPHIKLQGPMREYLHVAVSIDTDAAVAVEVTSAGDS